MNRNIFLSIKNQTQNEQSEQSESSSDIDAYAKYRLISKEETQQTLLNIINMLLNQQINDGLLSNINLIRQNMNSIDIQFFYNQIDFFIEQIKTHYSQQLSYSIFHLIMTYFMIHNKVPTIQQLNFFTDITFSCVDLELSAILVPLLQNCLINISQCCQSDVDRENLYQQLNIRQVSDKVQVFVNSGKFSQICLDLNNNTDIKQKVCVSRYLLHLFNLIRNIQIACYINNNDNQFIQQLLNLLQISNDHKFLYTFLQFIQIYDDVLIHGNFEQEAEIRLKYYFQTIKQVTDQLANVHNSKIQQKIYIQYFQFLNVILESNIDSSDDEDDEVDSYYKYQQNYFMDSDYIAQYLCSVCNFKYIVEIITQVISNGSNNYLLNQVLYFVLQIYKQLDQQQFEQFIILIVQNKLLTIQKQVQNNVLQLLDKYSSVLYYKIDSGFAINHQQIIEIMQKLNQIQIIKDNIEIYISILEGLMLIQSNIDQYQSLLKDLIKKLFEFDYLEVVKNWFNKQYEEFQEDD